MGRLIQPESQRLQLRQWYEEDRGAFAVLNADPQVMRYFPATFSRDQSDTILDSLKAHINEYGWGYWALELKSNKEFLGFVGIKHALKELPFSPCVEIGFRLAQPYWGYGYASEAARAVFKMAFKELNLTEIVGFTALQNLPSQRVMQGLGMDRDALIFDHPLVPENNPLRPHCLYRLSSEKWLEQQGKNALEVS
ncbi:GNAT family N-acetyltransferase [Microbulbifer variabilis]|uniref:GNAT family N-acetyltransferase n=1 Tax=Microbulbifer variabilis TaxID=266805 RepID=UPI001CFF0654|nr:GNAT family N-acetyltransferase [Microbulbifer variabilis]